MPSRPAPTSDERYGLTTTIEGLARPAPRADRSARPSRIVPLVVATFVALAPLPLPAETPLATLTVTASGEVVARPDVAVVTAGVVSEGRTTAQALAKADEAASALVAEAAAAGISKDDIATADFTVAPVWASPRPGGSVEATPRISGYTVSNTFTLKVRRIADLGPLLERIVGKGTNTVSGIAFEVSNAENRRDDARVAAVAAARKRAELLADAADQRLVRVLTLAEGSAPRPMPVVFAKAAMSAERAVPVEAGTQTIAAEVTITWELAPRQAP